MSKLIIGNLKMNLLSSLERERYLEVFKKELSEKKLKNIQFVLCPPAIHLEAFAKIKSEKISVGIQNIFWERSGAYTGEISGSMAKNFGADYVIIGHSERKKYFSEKNSEINLKVEASLRVGLSPVLCVGETRMERNTGQALAVISKQIKEALAGMSRTKAEHLIIAYEPVWAVGNDETPASNEIMEAKLLIRKILVGMFEKKYANLVKIIYGGSVDSKTVKEVCLEPAMDGALVGRESLMPYEFVKIAEIINN